MSYDLFRADYLAGHLAIDPEHPDEQIYLKQLAVTLQLPSELVAQLEKQVKLV